MIPYPYAHKAIMMLIIITRGSPVKHFFDKKTKKALEKLCDV